jgi:DNA-binding SARP family transcriptional activator
MTRSRLAGSLWPETPEQRALASLRTGIWRTNQVAHRLVMPAGGLIDLSSTVDVDTRTFVGSALQIMGQTGGDLPSQGPHDAPAMTEFAVDVLVADGELLPDWEDDWLVAERERLRQMRLHVLESTAAKLSEAGDYGLALEVALASVRIDPLRESAHRSVIRIHLAEGNVVEARRSLDICRETLMRDVGVELTDETISLVPLAASRGGVPSPR